MTLSSFGYANLRSDKIADWAEYGPKFLGLQLTERTGATLKFRMDDRRQRIVISSEESAQSVFGWEVDDGPALNLLAGRLEAAKVAVACVPAATAALRGVREAIRFADPAGNALEAFHGPETADAPFVPGRNISGFRTGPLGMGHVVLHVNDINDAVPFYRDVLGFRLSDYMVRPFNAYFFHANPRHHSIAFIETGRNATHHLMVELFSLDDVGQCYDLALTDPEKLIGVTLGRHINDEVTSFYSNSPSGFMVEYGWGGRVIDVDNWQSEEVPWGPSMWGHDRMWMTPEKRVESREIRIAAAATGLRKPVNVIEGNYERMQGVCPWWDNARAGEAAE
jgi:2,3-dihydroxybiphenyl 1,2-dioxygenase